MISHPPARQGHGLLPSECAAWQPCQRDGAKKCHFGMSCIYKHGDGKAQLESKHGSRSVQSHLAHSSSSPSPPAENVSSAALTDVPPVGLSPTHFADLLTQFMTSNHQLTAELRNLQNGRPGSPPVLLPQPRVAVPELPVAVPQLFQHRGTLMVSMLQVAASSIISNEGRRAASFFTSRGEQLGQALDSGGSDHIVGQQDVGLAYAWSCLRDPIPVTTAKGWSMQHGNVQYRLFLVQCGVITWRTGDPHRAYSR